MEYEYEIWGKYRGNSEEIDATDDEANANYLVAEYQFAFGNEWEIWIKEGG